jgi:hypothetical protein
MRLSIQGSAFAAALLWGGAILFVGLINLAAPNYGMGFLHMVSSVYPFFHASRTIGDVVAGTIDGLVDGAVAGALFAWLYNVFAGGSATT